MVCLKEHIIYSITIYTMAYHITLIVLKTITLLSVGSLHIHYALNAIHPQSLITGILFLSILYSIAISIDNVASLKA